MTFSVIILIVCLFLSMFFSGSETAVTAASEPLMHEMEKKGNKKAKTLRKLVEQPSRFLSTIQVAITLAGFLGSAFAADNFATRLTAWVMTKNIGIPESLVQSIAVIVITLVLSYVTLIMGELVPKRIAMKRSESVALGLAGFLWSVCCR